MEERSARDVRKTRSMNTTTSKPRSGARIAKTIYTMSDGSNDTVTGVLSGRALCEGRKEDTLNDHHHQYARSTSIVSEGSNDTASLARSTFIVSEGSHDTATQIKLHSERRSNNIVQGQPSKTNLHCERGLDRYKVDTIAAVITVDLVETR